MGQTYTRQSSFADGDTITAALFNNEYNQLVNAFSYSATNAATTGHRHDGSAGEGGNIPQIGDLDFLNKIVVDSTNNRWGFYVQVSTNTVEQIRLQDGALLPVTDSDVDLGTSSLYFKDAYIDSITTTGNVAVGGNLTVTGTTTFNGGTITMGDAATDNVVFGADVDSNIIPDDDDSYDLGSSSQEWRNLYIDGTANIDSLVADTADINGGTIDGAVIGGSSAAAITGTTITGTAITGTSFVIGSADISEAELEILDGATVTTDELNILDGVTSTTAELNILDGVTSTAAELNILDGVTSTAAEINLLDGVTSTTAELNILDGVTSTAAEINLLDGVTSTTAELNILDGVTASAADINLIDGITNGTVIASKAIVTDANKDITGGRNITITGELDAATLDISGNADIDGTLETDALSINGTTVTSTAAELNILDGVTATAAEINALDGITSTVAELNILDGVTSTAAELNLLDGKAFLDEDNMASNSATGIASQQSIKAYVDTQITAEDLDITTDSGTIAIDLDSETLTVSGGTGLDSSATGNAVTLAIDSTVATLTGSQTLTNKSLTAPTLTGTAVVASLDISGDIDVDGTTNLDVVDIDGAVNLAADATFVDNVKALFGTSGDLQIFHDGSNSYIKDLGTGDLLLSGNTGVQIQSDAGENMITTAANGAVSLFHDAAAKLATTSTGIDVTGTVTADGLTVDGDIRVNTTGTPSTSGVNLVLADTSNASAIQLHNNLGGSDGGALLYSSSASNFNVYNYVGAVGSETYINRFGISSNGDISFYEDTGTSQALFWDASAESLGIGTTSPTGKIHVVGRSKFQASGNDTAITLINQSGGDANLQILGTSTSAIYRFNTYSTGDALRIEDNGNVGIGVSPTQKLQVKAATDKNFIVLDSSGVRLQATNDAGTTLDTLKVAGNPLIFLGSGGAETARIDSSGKLLMGTTTSGTTDLLQIESPASGGGYGIQIRRNDNNTDQQVGQIKFGNTVDSDLGMIAVKTDGANNSGAILFSTASSQTTAERMRIDSSGNLLVGKTSTAFGTAGVRAVFNGQLQATADGNEPLGLNRLSSDGSLIDFYKDTSAVGSIGTKGGDLTIGTGVVGLRFHDGTGSIRPITTVDGTVTDDTVDLGTTIARFQDLYLSGGVVFDAVAGNATSNTLDDYEEGTWTPSIVSATGVAYSTQYGTYTKVGRNVTINFALQITTAPTGGSNLRMILPFEPLGSTTFVESGTLIVGAGLNMTADARNRIRIVSYQGSTNFYFYDMSSQDVFNYTSAFTTGLISASFTYQTE